MRVLLVNPPFYRLLGSHYNGLSLGLAYIAASLRAQGHDAWVYNADFSPNPTYKTLHQIYEDFGGFDQRPIRECIDGIVSFEPDAVGYSCYTATVPPVQEISREIRARIPGVIQVVGGPHATLDPRSCRIFPDVDYTVHGEGEFIMHDLITTRPARARVSADRIKNLDALPFPLRTHFWLGTGSDVCYVSTARGCPWRCHYCASPAIWPRVHSRSPENVLAEVATLPLVDTEEQQQNGTLHITDNTCLYIIDDTFTFYAPRTLRIIEGLDGIPWKCEARADTITPELAAAMAKHGCVRVKMGLESGSDRILKSVNKGETTEDVRRAVGLLQHHGVPVTLYLMAGFPEETDDDLRATIALARELKADYYSISMVAPYFGTKLHQDAIARGIRVDSAPWEVFFHHNDTRLLNRNLSRDLIEELWSLCDIRRYV